MALLAGTVSPAGAATDYVNCSSSSWNPAFRDIDPTNTDPDHTGTEVRVFGWVFCVENTGGQVVTRVHTWLEMRDTFGSWTRTSFVEPCGGQGNPSERSNSGTGCDETADYYPCPVADSIEIWRTYTEGEGFSPRGAYSGSIGDQFLESSSDLSLTNQYRCKPWVSSPPSP